MDSPFQTILGLAIIVGLIALMIFAVTAVDNSDYVTFTSPSSPRSQVSTSRSYVDWKGDRIAGAYYFGCMDKGYYEQLLTYATQGDQTAFSEGLALGLVSGNCCKFERGEPIYNMGGAFFSGLTQVRRPGELVEYWTVIEAIDPAD